MSDYTSKQEAIDSIVKNVIITTEEGLDLRNEIIELIKELPAVDETEIIRKPFERVFERLEEFTEQTYYKSVEGDMYAGERNKAYHNAIKILKEECGINE